jgi:Zn-dependent protease
MKFKIFGIEIVVTLYWWIFVGLISATWTMRSHSMLDGVIALVTLCILYSMVILHELGHAFAAIKLGYPVRKILLWPFGGLAVIDTAKNMAENHRHEFWIALCGPLVNVFLMMLAAPFAYMSHPLAIHLAEFMLGVNMIVLCFNMLPIYPMDGGRLLRSVFCWLFQGNWEKATRWAHAVAFITLAGVIPVLLYKGYWAAAIITPLVAYLGVLETKKLKEQRERKTKTVHRLAIVIDGTEMSPEEALNEIDQQLSSTDSSDLEYVTKLNSWKQHILKEMDRIQQKNNEHA